MGCSLARLQAWPGLPGAVLEVLRTFMPAQTQYVLGANRAKEVQPRTGTSFCRSTSSNAASTTCSWPHRLHGSCSALPMRPIIRPARWRRYYGFRTSCGSSRDRVLADRLVLKGETALSLSLASCVRRHWRTASKRALRRASGFRARRVRQDCARTVRGAQPLTVEFSRRAHVFGHHLDDELRACCDTLERQQLQGPAGFSRQLRSAPRRSSDRGFSGIRAYPIPGVSPR